jgi:hypothetical protein
MADHGEGGVPLFLTAKGFREYVRRLLVGMDLA